MLTRYQLFIVLALGFYIESSASNYWQRAVVNYSRQQYHSGNQNWQVAQNQEGWMYFANNKGLLEFDGSNWTTYPLPGNAKVRAVRTAGDTIYVGALGQFGRFTRNEKGRLVYERLSERPDKGGQLNVWHIHRIGNDTYYQSDNALYVNDSRTRLDSETGVSYSAVVYNRLYTASSRGISVLIGKHFQLLRGIDTQLAATIVAILPWQQGKLLLVSNDQGLFEYADNHLQPLRTVADATIRACRLSCAALSNGLLALGTMQHGVILLDLNRNTTEHLSIASGLQNKTVISVTFDRDQNLWLALDNGIDCIPLHSPLRFLNSRQSPIGSGYCSMVYNGKLYLGTNQGLYVMTMKEGEQQDIHFVEGTGSQVLCLDTVQGQLFCGGRRFFLSIDGDRITHYDTRGVWGVRSVGFRKDVLLTASYWGLRLMRRQGQGWRLDEAVKGTDISAKTFYVEDGTSNVWVANKEQGLFRLTLSDDLTAVRSQQCYNADQLPKGDNVAIARIDGETVIASRQGLFRYDTTHDRLEPHTSLEQRLKGHTAYTYLRQDTSGRIWYATDGTLHLDGSKHDNGYLNDYLLEDFESVSLMRNYAVIGTEEGFAALQLDRWQEDTLQTARAHPYIRKVYVGNYADTLYYGCRQPVTIRWRDNSIRLEYSTDNYDPTQTVLYSYWLEGKQVGLLHTGIGSTEEEWSPYSRRRIKEFTNLGEGDYVFHLRIMTTGSQQPVETTFAFTVLPPWYRTWWAYTLYALLTGVLAILAYRRLQRSRQQLVAAKDEQIHEQEEQIETLQAEKLEMELRSKQDELVRSRMNVVRKNEMLQEIRKTAISLNNGLNEENLAAARRRVVRLIGQIDVNIAHDDDLEAFKDSFDAVHHRFLQTLSERYPTLSHKEKMLCAYIRMNLLSKEIAPLLNISTRGVEISRYRLRKKLGLDEGINLQEYLQRL